MVLEKLHLGEPVSTNRADMFLLLLGVVRLHMQCEILLSVKLFSAFLTTVIKVYTVGHLFVLQQLGLPLVTFITLCAAKWFDG